MRNTEDISSTVAQRFYDNREADYFYRCIWGGEDIHVGIYKNEAELIFDASRRTIAIMASFLKNLTDETHILDIGSGYGGAARYLSEKFNCNIVCLNISKVQNDRNILINREKNMDKSITVEEGNFEKLPYDNETFNIIWSQDALLHSNNRTKVLKEVYRALKIDGEFIFTDIMANSGCSDSVLEPVLNRIHLKSLGTLNSYIKCGKSLGFDVEFHDFSENLSIHYSRILEETQLYINQLQTFCSEEFLKGMILGLKQWISASEKHYLTWGVLKLTKKYSESKILNF